VGPVSVPHQVYVDPIGTNIMVMLRLLFVFLALIAIALGLRLRDESTASTQCGAATKVKGHEELHKCKDSNGWGATYVEQTLGDSYPFRRYTIQKKNADGVPKGPSLLDQKAVIEFDDTGCLHEHNLNSKIANVRTFCYSIKKVPVYGEAAFHCQAVLGLANGNTVILEQFEAWQGGWESRCEGAHCDGGFDVQVKCSILHTSTPSDDELLAASGLKELNDGSAEVYRKQKPVKGGYIAGYKHAGFRSPEAFQCEDTSLRSMISWSIAYLNNYPKYDWAHENCQKFSVGIYNALTKECRDERQRYGSAIAGSLGHAFASSSSASGSIAGSISDASASVGDFAGEFSKSVSDAMG